MVRIKLTDICDFQGGSQPPKNEWSKELKNGYIRMLQIRDFTQNEKVIPEYIKISNKIKTCKSDDVLIARYGASIGKILTGLEGAYNVAIMKTIPDLSVVRKRYLYYYLKSSYFQKSIMNVGLRAAQAGFNKDDLSKLEINCPNLECQDKIIKILDKILGIIDKKQGEIKKLDNLIQARFVELFGDLKSNNKRWPIVGFKECADIDTNMIHNFEGYEDYPHIGINCIEKETGRLIGYRTIAEDGVISGKYLFTPKHIIYSKIRPNLNKVALPDFKGLCSADAYPILVKSEICNREYFGYTLRSKYFLDYILAFSNRTNLPKVNKNQVEGFMLPLPPIDLQNQFAAFVHQINKSKFVIHKFLYCTTHNTKSIIKPRPNTKESGKIRGGKPHADEF